MNYVPWQDAIPTCRRRLLVARSRGSPGVALGDWSEVRSFALSLDLLTGNQYDFRPAPYRVPLDSPNSLLTNYAQYSPALSHVASSAGSTGDEFALDRLHVLIDRTYVITEANLVRNFNWAFAFNINPIPGKAVRYGIYVDNNHFAPAKTCANLAPGEPDAGGTGDPIGQGVTSLPLYAPEYVIYVEWDGSAISAVNYYRWNGVMEPHLPVGAASRTQEHRRLVLVRSRHECHPIARSLHFARRR